VTPKPTDPEEAFLVHADELVAAGDPRGELILLQHANDPSTVARRDELIRAIGPAPSREFEARWRLGYIRELFVRRSSPLSALAHPSFAVLEKLSVADIHASAALEVLASPVVQRLRSLTLVPGSLTARSLRGAPSLAHLEELDLRLNFLFTEEDASVARAICPSARASWRVPPALLGWIRANACGEPYGMRVDMLEEDDCEVVGVGGNYRFRVRYVFDYELGSSNDMTETYEGEVLVDGESLRVIEGSLQLTDRGVGAAMLVRR
jgi:hypothetical protein